MNEIDNSNIENKRESTISIWNEASLELLLYSYNA